MDEIELEQNLAEIYSAIRMGNSNAARNAFEASIQKAVDVLFDQVTDIIVKKYGMCTLIVEIEQLLYDK